MAVHYSRLPTSEADILPKKSYMDFESAQDIKKKYKSIYDYSDGVAGYAQEDENVAAPQNLLCRWWSICLTAICYIGVFVTMPITGWFCFKTVPNYERLVIFRLGRLVGAKGPGVVMVLPCLEKIIKVDLRMKAFSVPPQKILTNDNAAVEAGADVFYRVKDPIMSVNCVQDFETSARILAQTSLQTHLAKQTLSDNETNKHMIAQLLQESINLMTKKWGVEVSRVDISQIKVVQGPPEPSCNPQNLLNMITPALFPAGSGNSGTPQQGINPPQLTVAQAALMQAECVAAANPQFAAAQSSGPAVLEVEGATARTVSLGSPKDLISRLRQHLSVDLVQQFGLVYKFIVLGQGGGSFFLDLKHGGGSTGEGDPLLGTADVTVSMNMEVLHGMLSGNTSVFSAYMTGQLSVDGDVQGAMQLGKLIEFIK